jgi:serine/threonine protein kinase
VTGTRRAVIDAAFDAALEQPPAERERWLREHYAAEPWLVTEVKALLDAHDRAEGILEAGPLMASLGRRPADEGKTDRRIGPYRVVRELGRGGMGVVYLAERDDGQFHRRVAVKLLRASPDADELQRRFLAERQILASLDHPNIAQLLDGGVTDGQLPYLVMEYVEGLPITTYCDRHRLGLDERLRLFLDVCAAVRHAHQNLVVHRDLKPGNILVTTDGRVKLLDFGIAKLLNSSVAGVAQPVTRTEFRVMTPEYASPEQVCGHPLSTASDVYSLGVVLYELLAGRRPYRITSQQELAAIVCQREPPRPSSRVVEPAPKQEDTGEPVTPAAARGMTPDRLRRSLQGDLDAIVMMALRKEPRERYGTAERLAQDVERYLDGRPVLAHRGSRWYRLRRFAVRHRGRATAAAVVVLSLLVGSGVALWQAAAARSERDRAATALSQSEEVSRFMIGLFEASDPFEPGSDQLTAHDLLRRGGARVDELRGQPLVQARMLDVLGRVHGSLGDYNEGAGYIERALALRAAELDSTSPEITGTLYYLSEGRLRQRRYAEAESLAQRGIRLRRLADPDDPDIARFLTMLSGLAVYRSNLPDADSFAREALEIRRRTGGPGDSLLVYSMELVAAQQRRLGRVAEAEHLFREALAIQEGGDPSSPAASFVRLRLADLLSQERDAPAEAEPLYLRAITDLRARLGPNHPRMLYALNDYGGHLVRSGRAAQGDSIFRANLDTMRRVFGPDHPTVTYQLSLRVGALIRMGRYAEAEPLAREQLAKYDQAGARATNEYTGALGALARVLAGRGRFREADSLVRAALDIRVHMMGETETPLHALSLATWAGILTAEGAYPKADSLYQEALRILLRYTSEQHRDVRRLHAGLAALYDAWGRPDQAARHHRIAGPYLTPY